MLARKVTTSLAHDDDLVELAVVWAEDQILIGDVLLALRSVEHQTVEFGYIFSPAYSGQGYATEAVHALLEVAFMELDAGVPMRASTAGTSRPGHSSKGSVCVKRHI